MPFIEKKLRKKDYDNIVEILANGFAQAAQYGDAAIVNYVISKAVMLAWERLNWGYNHSRELKSILTDIADEFQRRRNQYEAMKQEVNGDINENFEQMIADKGENLVKIQSKVNIKKPEKKITDIQGNELKSKE